MLKEWINGFLRKFSSQKPKDESPKPSLGKTGFRFVFKPAQRYEMYVKGSPGVVYKGIIDDVANDLLYLSAPLERSVPIYLPKNTEVILKIVGLSSGQYEFETRVADNVIEGVTVPKIILEKPSSILRKQRRKHPRVRTFFKASYKIIERTLRRGVAVPLRGKVDVWDISAVGIALIFKDEIPLYTRMQVAFVLPDSSIPVQAICEVANTRYSEYDQTYIVGLLFVDITEENRGFVDKFVQMQLPRSLDGFIG